MWRRCGTPQNFLLAFIELWKIRKIRISEFWKNEKIIVWYIIILHVYQKPQSYGVWFLRSRGRQNVLSFWAIFLPFYPSNSPENQNFENMNKASQDFIISHLCTKKHNHIMYAYSDMECNRHNFLPF